MREIKFRAIYQRGLYTWEKNKKTILQFLSEPSIWIGVQLLQFTESKDKNRKEIYEGDLMKSKDMRKNQKPLVVKLEPYEDSEGYNDNIHQGWALFKGKKRIITLPDACLEGYNVIRNKFENLELLK